MEYIKGPKNIVANTLSHLEMTSNKESLDMADCYGLDSDDLPDDAFLVSHTLLDHKQKNHGSEITNISVINQFTNLVLLAAKQQTRGLQTC
jgi:hypothetical protein